jgi:hypothetical protein
LLNVPLQLGQVVERVGVVQLAGVDQAHEQVADAGAVLATKGFIKPLGPVDILVFNRECLGLV